MSKRTTVHYAQTAIEVSADWTAKNRPHFRFDFQLIGCTILTQTLENLWLHPRSKRCLPLLVRIAAATEELMESPASPATAPANSSLPAPRSFQNHLFM